MYFFDFSIHSMCYCTRYNFLYFFCSVLVDWLVQTLIRPWVRFFSLSMCCHFEVFHQICHKFKLDKRAIFFLFPFFSNRTIFFDYIFNLLEACSCSLNWLTHYKLVDWMNWKLSLTTHCLFLSLSLSVYLKWALWGEKLIKCAEIIKLTKINCGKFSMKVSAYVSSIIINK